MRIVYMTGTQQFRNFEVADSWRAVPEHATVIATCKQQRTVEQLSPCLFSELTDEEFYELRATVRSAEELEAQEPPASPRKLAVPLRHLSALALRCRCFFHRRAQSLSSSRLLSLARRKPPQPDSSSHFAALKETNHH